jgi:hypothetical protein
MKFEDITKIPEKEYVTCQRIVEHCRWMQIPYIKPDPIKYRRHQFIVSNNGWNGLYDICTLDKTPVIVTGYSDFPIGISELDILEQPALKKWFANNIDMHHPKLVAVPLGLPNEVDFPVYGNTRRLHKVAQTPKSVRNLVYMNFKIETYPRERRHVCNLFKDQSWVTTGTLDLTEDGHQKYLEDIHNHKFCLCPRGNGVDTHRMWEAMYLGSIPICKRSTTLEQFSGLLPILFIDDWSDIHPEYLEQVYENFLAREWNIDTMLMSYWKPVLSCTFNDTINIGNACVYT